MLVLKPTVLTFINLPILTLTFVSEKKVLPILWTAPSDTIAEEEKENSLTFFVGKRLCDAVILWRFQFAIIAANSLLETANSKQSLGNSKQQTANRLFFYKSLGSACRFSAATHHGCQTWIVVVVVRQFITLNICFHVHFATFESVQTVAHCTALCVGQSVVIMVMEEEQICCGMTLLVFPSAICSDCSLYDDAQSPQGALCNRQSSPQGYLSLYQLAIAGLPRRMYRPQRQN